MASKLNVEQYQNESFRKDSTLQLIENLILKNKHLFKIKKKHTLIRIIHKFIKITTITIKIITSKIC